MRKGSQKKAVLFNWNGGKVLKEVSNMAIGGLLILVGIGVVVGPLFGGYNLYQDLAFVYDSKLQMVVQLVPAYKFIYGTSFAMDIASFAFVLLLPYLFFARKATFPKVYIFSLVFSVATPVIAVFLVTIANSICMEGTLNFSDALQLLNRNSLIRGAIKCCVWIPYMCCSSRVKNTFVR